MDAEPASVDPCRPSLSAASIFEDEDMAVKPASIDPCRPALSAASIFEAEDVDVEPASIDPCRPALSAASIFEAEDVDVEPAAARLEEAQQVLDEFLNASERPAEKKRGRPKGQFRVVQPKVAATSRSERNLSALALNRQKRWQVARKTAANSSDASPNRPNLIINYNPEDSNHILLSKLASLFFTSDVLRGPLLHSSSLVGCSPQTLGRTMVRLAALTCDHAATFSQDLVDGLVRACETTSGQSQSLEMKPRLYLSIRQYDETPLKLRVSHPSDSGGGKGDAPKKQTAKLFLTLWRHASMICAYNRGHFMGSCCFEAQVPTRLQVIGSNTGPVIAKALHLQQQSLPHDIKARQSFQRSLDCVTTDNYSANHLAEKLLAEHQGNTGSGFLHVTCAVHAAHGCAGAAFHLIPEFSSGLIKAALALNSGQMAVFRKALEQVIEQKLVVYYDGQPGIEADCYRRFVFQTFSQSSAKFKSSGPEVLESLFNGNFAEQQEIQHFCRGCCTSKSETMAKMKHYALKILAGSIPKVFARHKWVGASECIDYFARLHALGLLRPAFERIWGKGLENQEDNDQNEALAALLPLPQDSVESGEVDFKIICKRWRETALTWSKRASLMSEFIFARLMIEPQSMILHSQLAQSASSWDAKQLASEIQNGTREYRVLRAFQNIDSSRALRQIQELLHRDFSGVEPCYS